MEEYGPIGVSDSLLVSDSVFQWMLFQGSLHPLGFLCCWPFQISGYPALSPDSPTLLLSADAQRLLQLCRTAGLPSVIGAQRIALA